MSNSDIILEYLHKISPRTATNADIGRATGIRPHQQIFQITQKLEKGGQIQGRLCGKEWEFWVSPQRSERGLAQPTKEHGERMASRQIVNETAAAFEARARKVLHEHYQTELVERSVEGIAKRWDFLSPNGNVIGDAKFYSLVQGERYPPAKMSVIAEHVWLLEKTNANVRFLVFGNDRRVPEMWINRYGYLARSVAFWFLGPNELERLGV